MFYSITHKGIKKARNCAMRKMGCGRPVDGPRAARSNDRAGRWGEVEKEKGPVDLFPTEPTDEARKGEETLDPGSKELLRPCKK